MSSAATLLRLTMLAMWSGVSPRGVRHRRVGDPVACQEFGDLGPPELDGKVERRHVGKRVDLVQVLWVPLQAEFQVPIGSLLDQAKEDWRCA